MAAWCRTACGTERPPLPPFSAQGHEGGGDPAAFAAQQAPGAGGGAAVHRLDADALRLERADEWAGREGERWARAEQEEFRWAFKGEERFELLDGQAGCRPRRRPAGRRIRREQ